MRTEGNMDKEQSEIITAEQQPSVCPDKQKSAIRFTVRGFIGVVAVLFGLIIAVGILTLVIPSGRYLTDANGGITDTFVFAPAENSLPWWLWPLAPFMVWGSSDGFNLGFLSLLLLIMGGAFFVIEKTGGMQAIINAIIRKFGRFKYALIWVTAFFFMLLAAVFGSFEDALILLPIILVMCRAMKWDGLTALGMMLLAAGVGLSCTWINYFSIGLASNLAGTNVLSGLWYRILIWLFMWALTSLFVTYFFARKAEKKNAAPGIAQGRDGLLKEIKDSTPEDKRKVTVFTLFFLAMAAIIVGSYSVDLFFPKPVVADYIMPIMGAAFLIGGIVCGCIVTKSFKVTMKFFGKGALAIAPAVLILMLSFSIKYIAERGEILHTIFYYFSGLTADVGPYAAIILIYLAIFIFNFFIPSSSAKVIIAIPLLTLLPIAGLSKEIIILAFVLSEGFSDVFFPTSPVLLVGLSFADVSYGRWFRKTALFQLLLFGISCAVLVLGVWFGY